VTLYRRTVVFEVLADADPAGYDIDELIAETRDGGFSGCVLADTTVVVDADAMRGLLLAQGSDPEFLLGASDDDSDTDDEPGEPRPTSYCRFCHRDAGADRHYLTAAEPGSNPWVCDDCWDDRLN
jgi:hypothetical protein